ncbi:MAG: hypothetical protein PHW29_08710 [Flavobacterium sp.]|nr:hypothetical protein [Flavobacterium sp.]
MKKGFLLGAGFSYDFGMPLAGELTEVFFGLFNKKNVQNLANRLAQNQPYNAERPINKKAILEGLTLLLKHKDDNQKNYEQFLADLQQLSQQPNKSLSDKDSYSYLFGLLYELIHSILSLYQEESFGRLYCVNKKLFTNFSTLFGDEETWIFTLNHDLYMETLAIDLKIPITYGDCYNISFPVSNHEMNNNIIFTYSNRKEINKVSQNFYEKEFGINLVKLHGGLSELDYKDRSMICNQDLKKKSSFELMADFIKIQKMAYYHGGRMIPSGKDRVITNNEGELDIICKSMLTGGKKYSNTTNPKDGEEKLLIFDDVIKTLDEFIIIGYGFGDKHVNNRILNAMVLNNNLQVTIVDSQHRPIPEFLEQFNYHSRIKRVQSSIALWIEYCYTGKWNQEYIEILKQTEQLREEIKSSVEQRLKDIVKEK